MQRTSPLKKPVKKTAKKATKRAIAKKAPAKKTPAKKAKAKPAGKPAAKKTPRKSVKKTAKPAVRKAAKKVGKKPVVKAKKAKNIRSGINRVVVTDGKIAAKKLTKTAERKAVRAAKAAKVAPKPKAVVIAKPVWPPLVEAALKCLDDAKAEDVITIDLVGKSTLADTMIVASGRSNRHVNAIADQMVEEMKKQGQTNLRIEGIPQCDWVIVDAGDLLLHIFRPEVRSFYNLEKLWSAHVPE